MTPSGSPQLQTETLSTVVEPIVPENVDIDAVVALNQKKKRERKEVQPLTREPGKSLLPFSRVQKILKADKELPIVAREATFLISLATEEFIKHIAEEGGIVAARENRVTVQYKDIANVVRRVDKFMFLDEIIPLQDPDPPARRKPKAAGKDNDKQRTATMLDGFVTVGKQKSSGEHPDVIDEDIVMNEDGTMTTDQR